MSSLISQNVLMALTVTVNKYASSNVNAVYRRENNKTTSSTTTANSIMAASEFGRRCVLLSAAAAAPLLPYPINHDSKSQLLQKYLKKSKENKAKNDKERLDSYYKRNYKDYFDYVEGSLKGQKEEDLTESEKRILDWLKKNK